MNTLLLLMLTLIEIGLAAITLSENRTKKIWYRNRLWANILEILAFLVFAFFPGVGFNFRFYILISFLLLRTLGSLIRYLRKSNTEGQISKAKVVSHAIIAVVLLIIVSLPSFLFNYYKGLEPTGSYKTASAEAILVDPSRVESFETDGSNREVPVNFFYPEDYQGEKLPLVIFSHGAFGYYKSNYSLYQELVSEGYVVASLSHPYHSFFCKDTSGKLITVNQDFMNDALHINDGTAEESEIFAISSEWVKLRTEDIAFVLDSLAAYQKEESFNSNWYMSSSEDKLAHVLAMVDFDHIGVMGHSLGGAAAVNIGRIRDDVDAVVDLDGTMIGEELDLVKSESYEFQGITYHQKYVLNEEPYPVSILNIDNQEHHDSRLLAKEIDMPYANNYVMEHALDGYDTYFVNAGHMNLTDLPLFSSALAAQLGTGSIDAKECIETMNQLVLNFYDATLKHQGTFTLEESYGN